MQHATLDAKVVILGSQGVGKTSLVVRYVQNTFSPNCPSTIGASFTAKKIMVDALTVKLQIWDTAGQERFRSMTPMYYRGANAAILVYDITSRESFEDIETWVEELRQNTKEDIIIQIVGNKVDLASARRAIPLQVAEEYAQNQLGEGAAVFEVSAKDDEGIEEMFFDLTRRIVMRRYEILQRQRNKVNGNVELSRVQDEKYNTSWAKGCCSI